jgi:TetR/AcrR family transcriptional repressor of bet genes
MARPSNTRARRAEITRGLMRVMARTGYEAASIAEIASAAGLTPGLVHYHFESKEEILLELVEHVVEWLERRLERAVAAAGRSPRAQLEALIDAHLALGKDQDPEILACWIGILGEALRRPPVKARVARALEPVAARLEDLCRRVGGPVPPAAAAAGLLATIHGYYVLSALARPLIPRGSAAPTARALSAALGRKKGNP